MKWETRLEKQEAISGLVLLYFITYTVNNNSNHCLRQPAFRSAARPPAARPSTPGDTEGLPPAAEPTACGDRGEGSHGLAGSRPPLLALTGPPLRDKEEAVLSRPVLLTDRTISRQKPPVAGGPAARMATFCRCSASVRSFACICIDCQTVG